MTITSLAEALVSEFGEAAHSHACQFTQDQLRAMYCLYSIHKDSPCKLTQAGSTRNVFRAAEMDGLRMVAWMARYLSPGTDPLKELVRLATNSGWEVDPEDSAWANSETNEESEKNAD